MTTNQKRWEIMSVYDLYWCFDLVHGVYILYLLYLDIQISGIPVLRNSVLVQVMLCCPRIRKNNRPDAFFMLYQCCICNAQTYLDLWIRLMKYGGIKPSIMRYRVFFCRNFSCDLLIFKAIGRWGQHWFPSTWTQISGGSCHLGQLLVGHGGKPTGG